MEERILDPVKEGCVCDTLAPEEILHFLLVGDKRKQDRDDDLEWCIKEGLLKENREKEDADNQ